MLSILTGFITGLFSSSKTTDLAIDALRKTGGLDDMKPQEVADFLLKWIENTKHQSPTRRFLAVGVFFIWSLLIVVWIVFKSLGIWFISINDVAGEVKELLLTIVNDPFTYILSFYFVVDIARQLSGIKGAKS
ncbi:hypothetical protein A134_23195 [Vibrio crassostreae 9CS106]|uniref:TMhelix containing protein n=1 Tax=Vibrio crassostreae 9CS106 TaxID=1191300 RepID=A0A1B1C3E8_9VIBR|nr:hypothetical protein A134_23195 [Vibrio crassostreae 9CS106]